MKEQENDFEARLKKHLQDEKEKYPLPEAYFSSFKDRLLDKIDLEVSEKPKGKSFTLNWWILPASMAACLALFALVKPAAEKINDPIQQELLSEVVIFEEPASPFEKLDSTVLDKASELEIIQNIQAEVELEALYDDDTDNNSIASLEEINSEDLEDYLIDNLNLNTEL